MSCHDARERLSELIDDTLDPVARTSVDAHLSGCAECRRELDCLERTVALLRTVEPVRAPVGFVDRVLAVVEPLPWYRRVGARLARLHPFGVPIEAVALAMVATLAVFVLEHSPELRQAAREETSPFALHRDTFTKVSGTDGQGVSPVSGERARPPMRLDEANRASVPRDADVATGELRDLRPSVASETAPPPKESPPRVASSRPDPKSAAGRQEVEPDPSRRARADVAANTSGPDVVRDRAEPVDRAAPLDAAGAASTPLAASATPATEREPVARPDASAAGQPVLPSSEMQQRAKESQEMREIVANSLPIPREPGPMHQSSARTSGPAADASRVAPAVVPLATPRSAAARSAARVSGRLAVADQDAADRELAALLSRVGGAELARRAVGATVVVEVMVPGPRYAAFSSGLTRIGTWAAGAPSGDSPAEVVVTLFMSR